VPPSARDEGFLIDPRIGFDAPPVAPIESKFDLAWRSFLSGDFPVARQRLASIRAKYPDYLPATLAEGAILIREHRLSEARALVDQVRSRQPRYTAAEVYEAEILLATNETTRALEAYRSVVQRTDAPPVTRQRLSAIEQRYAEQLIHDAAAVRDDAEAARLLREALSIDPAAHSARVQLAQKLVAMREFDEARKSLEPLLATAEVDRTDVQETLAEIDAGRGRFEEAIARYERLARRERDPRYATRLEEIKLLWNAANMPPQFQHALESQSLTRAEFAVLLYWTVPSVRFAQNLSAPPIAIDIGDVEGRDEIIRAIAAGIFYVDPITRRVDPLRPINAGALTRLVARTLSARGAGCTRLNPAEPSEPLRNQKILAACGITDPSAGLPPESPVTGQMAAAVLTRIDRVLSAEQR
jgi:predicted Zn-dependent protease